VPDELLDVDAAIAKRATFAIRFGDLGLDRDDTLEPGLEVRDFAHPSGTLPERDSGSAAEVSRPGDRVSGRLQGSSAILARVSEA